MSIKITCSNCKADYELKDELAWKKAKCANCGNIIEIPELIVEKNIIEPEQDIIIEKNNSVETSISDSSTNENVNQKNPINIENKGVFSHNIYWVKQKKIAINEKYYIKDKDNNDLLFSIRRVYLMRSIFSFLVLILTFLFFIWLWFTLFWNNYIYIIIFIFVWFISAIFMSIFVYPKRHICFHINEDDINWIPEFEVQEDSKYQIITKTYTMLGKNKEILCKYKKNVFTNIFRKKWHMEFDWKHIVVKEDSIILGLLRRFFTNLIRTNFIFTDESTWENLWIFKRKFELFDNYVLDLSNDIAYKIPRKLSIWMAVLLDTWERR